MTQAKYSPPFIEFMLNAIFISLKEITEIAKLKENEA